MSQSNDHTFDDGLPLDSLFEQPRLTWTPPLVLCAALLPALLVVAVAALQTWVPLDELMRDPIAVAVGNDKFYYGAVSNLGVLLWCAAAMVCVFTAALLKRRREAGWAAAFMLCAGLYSSMMLFDDLFLIHEQLKDGFLGLNERKIFFGYGLLLLALLFVFRRYIFDTEPALLVISLLFFGMSVISDLFVREATISARLMEDGSKFLGIAAWAGYHLRAAWLLLQRY